MSSALNAIKTLRTALGGAAIAAVFTTSAAATDFCNAEVRTTPHDLYSIGASVTINDAIFYVPDPAGPAATVVYDQFVRIQTTSTFDNCEQGYNTGDFLQFDEVAGFVRDLLLTSVPLIAYNGTDYREFVLDINQVGEGLISLDQVRLIQAPIKQPFTISVPTN